MPETAENTAEGAPSNHGAGEAKPKPGNIEEYPLGLAARMASQFALEGPREVYNFADKGNINQLTFLIQTRLQQQPRDLLLQCINQQVFVRPTKVMEAMVACLAAQRSSVRQGLVPKGRPWEVITLIPTRAGHDFLTCTDRLGTAYWRMMVKIPSCVTFKSLSELPSREEQVAIGEEAGRGLAMFGDFTAGIAADQLVSPLPGYRDTRLYCDQLKSVLAGHRTLAECGALLPSDPVVRASTEQHFLVHLPEDEFRRRLDDPELADCIRVAREYAAHSQLLVAALDSGRVRKVIIHGDTKLDNFLFCSDTRRVKALVDLDTLMPQTWLVDWGDMVRSLINVAGESEPDVDKVRVDDEIYAALAGGFLSTARSVTAEEVSLMVHAVELIAYELGIRFLADYLRGDNYFTLALTDPPELNKTRARTQLRLFERLLAQRSWATKLVAELARTHLGMDLRTDRATP